MTSSAPGTAAEWLQISELQAIGDLPLSQENHATEQPDEFPSWNEVDMSTTRRKFLQGGTGAAAAAAFGSVLGAHSATAATSGATTSTAVAASLRRAFKTPPNEWAPRVWWHWMSPNDTTEGIVKDLDWWKRVGVGGFHQFTGNGGNSYVQKPIVYMTPEFKEAWALAIKGAADRGLESTLTSSAGWSITGAPFVAAADGMKKHVWTETWVNGGAPVTVNLPQPFTASGSFLDKVGRNGGLTPLPTYYKDQRVFAYQVDDAAKSQADLAPNVYFSAYSATANGPVQTNGTTGVLLHDADLAKLGNASIVDPVYLRSSDAWVVFEYDSPVTIGGLVTSLNGQDFGGWVDLIETGNQIEVHSSTDGTTWGPALALKDQTGSNIYAGAQRTFAITATTAKYFKVVFVSGADFQLTKLILRTVPTVHKWEHKAGFGEVGNFYLIDTPGGGLPAVKKSSVKDLTAVMKANGTLTWTPPRGRWVIVRLGYSLTGHQNSPTTAAATGLEVDKIDADRVRAYMNTYLDQFQAAVPAELWGGKGLSGLLCDSIEAGFQTWTDTIIHQFTIRRGYDPRPWLPVLIGTVVESAAESDKFLWDWRTTVSDLIVDCHYKTIREVVHERGLRRFYCEAQEDRRGFFGDDTSIRIQADIPMGASRSVGSKLGGVVDEQFRLDMKGASSVAHVYGREYAACETFTSTSIQYLPRDLKPFADQVLVAGITRFVVHSSDQQPLDLGPGTSLGTGYYMTRNQTWAELAGPFVTWMGRTSGLLNQGTNVADVAYFYGQEAPLTEQWLATPAGFGRQPDIPCTCQYDFVNNEIILNELRIQENKFVTRSGQSYSLLYLGGMSNRMTLDVLTKLRHFVTSGGAICGPKPTESPSLADSDKAFQSVADKLWGNGTETLRRVGRGHVMTGLSPDAALAKLGVAPDWTFTPKPSRLTLVHRSTGDADIYFVVNNDHANPVTATLSLRAVGSRVELWDAVSGKAWPTSFDSRSGRTVLPLTLGPADSVFVVIGGKGKRGSATVPAITDTAVASGTGAWKLTFSPPRGTPDSLRLTALTDLSSNAITDVKYYSGTMVYTTTLTTNLDPGSVGGARILLDLGEVNEFAEVTVNGVDLEAILWRAPYRVDVTDVLRRGDNTVEVRVTNGWYNRVLGDMQPGVSTTYATRYNNDSFGVSATGAINPSGLVGPVTLVLERGRQKV